MLRKELQCRHIHTECTFWLCFCHIVPLKKKKKEKELLETSSKSYSSDILFCFPWSNEDNMMFQKLEVKTELLAKVSNEKLPYFPEGGKTKTAKLLLEIIY